MSKAIDNLNMIKLFYFILISFLSSSFSFSKEAGEVTYVRGKVMYKSKKIKTLKVFKGMVFDERSSFTTGKGAIIILDLKDGSKIKLSSRSKIQINNLKTKNKPTTTSLVTGNAFFSILKSKITKKSKFKVRTKTAALGVRGTSFFVSYGKDEVNNDIWMCVNEGLVSVRARKVKNTTFVKAGQGVQIASHNSISEPRALAWTSRLNWNMNPLQGNIKNTVNIEDAYLDILDQDYD